jgi:serine/threonine-protein kinase
MSWNSIRGVLESNPVSSDPENTANKIARADLLVSILAIIVGAIFALVPQEIKCNLGLLPRSCKGIYFISDNAYITVGEADQRSIQLKENGYPGSGHFFIPDYPNLSGKHLYVVYVDQFYHRDDCARSLESYSKKNPKAYCLRASTNPSVDPDRFCAESIDCLGSQKRQ